jgi:anti-sigma factor RsiW
VKNNAVDRNALILVGLHREITPAERSEWDVWLRAHPQEAPEYELDLALNGLLRKLPDRPVPSNFTHQVVQAVLRDRRDISTERQATGTWRTWLRARAWISKVAVSAVIVSTALLSYHQHQVRTRLELARSVAQVSGVTSLLNAEVLENFEVINRLAQVPVSMDDELYLALK